MRFLHFSLVVAAFAVTLPEPSYARGLFRGCHTCSPPSPGGNSPRNTEAVPPPKNDASNVPMPTLRIVSSGLEAEVVKRIAAWEQTGVTTGGMDGAKVVIVEVGGQKVEIRIRIIGGGVGGGGPDVKIDGDLTKTLQKAYDSDTTPAGADKAKAKATLIGIYTELANRVRSSDTLMLGTEAVADKATLRRFKLKAIDDLLGRLPLENTQEVIDTYLDKVLPRNDKAKLTAAIRTNVADEFAKVAAALSAVK